MADYFKSTKLSAPEDSLDGDKFHDASDALANQGFVVTFQHVPTGNTVSFKAFINALNETYSCDWNSEQVYGRTDPIQIFKQTTRNISLSLIIPASTHGEGYENLAKVDELVTYLYPSYESIDNALTIAQSPLIRLSVMNLIKNHNNNKSSYQSLRSGAGKSKSTDGNEGLLGVIQSLTVNHNLESLEMGSFMMPGGKILPKAIEIALDFTALHEKTLGWQNDNFSSGASIYGTDYSSLPGSAAAPTGDGNSFANNGTTTQNDADGAADASIVINNGNRLGNYGYADATPEEQAATDEIGEIFDQRIG